MAPFTVTNGDFVSIDTAGVRGPRKADGSLPDVDFMHLAQGSDLIDGGTDVGLPYIGTAPDLGYAESDYPLAVEERSSLPGAFALHQNYPNPFNPATVIRFSVRQHVRQDGILSYKVSLRVYNMLGQLVATLVDEVKAPGEYSVRWNASNAPSGMYIYRLEAGAFTEVKKMILMK
jgi:hypothetical protein